MRRACRTNSKQIINKNKDKLSIGAKQQTHMKQGEINKKTTRQTEKNYNQANKYRQKGEQTRKKKKVCLSDRNSLIYEDDI